jgi:molybdenum cofactor cytidylyltransferase
MSAANNNPLGITILAAGSSRRLGRPKQLLKAGGATLLGHAVQAALGCGSLPVVVVLGAHHQAILPLLQGLPVQICINPYWHQGMASSVRSGLQFLVAQKPALQQALLMVCDQPFVTKKHLLFMLAAQKSTGKGIVASSYGGKMGTSALFSRQYFEALLQLEGDTGAKGLLIQYQDDVAAVDFAGGAFDIDTPQDYKKLTEQWGERHDS